jgi:hypothetical protein
VLKAAQIATVEPGPDASKRIHQRHFIHGMEEVIAGESVMSQSLFDEPPAGSGGVLERLAEGQEELRGELALMAERVDGLAADRAAARVQLERQQSELLERVDAGRRKQDRLLLAVAASGVLLALLALVLSLVAR